MKYLLPILLGLTLCWAVSASFKAFGGVPDAFVRMLEMRQGISPGATKVLTECGCTIRYLGTTVSGNHYAVHIDKLD